MHACRSTLEDPTIIAETETFDPNRDVQDLRYREGQEVDVSRLAFLVGPVRVEFGADPERTKVTDLSPYIDGEARRVRSNTGQIKLDYGVGLFTLDAPKAQGVAGFLAEAGGRFELSDVTIESDNDYATIEAVSMDGKPLAGSARVLLQVGTVAKLTGWTTVPDSFEQGDGIVQGRRIVYTGKPPWRMKNTRATVTVANPGLSSATLLDGAGYAVRDLPVQSQGDALKIILPDNAMYVVLQ